jgi:toxin-antitoxin system PIN domain toxin
MMAVDTNVLVYAHRREAAEHAAASELVRSLAEATQPWAVPWPCLYEFFSVVTHPKIWRGAASTPSQAWAQIEAWLGSPSLRLLAETPEFGLVLARFLDRARVRGPIVHDARVAALCVAHGVEVLLTRDRDFSLFGELRTRNPLA